MTKRRLWLWGAIAAAAALLITLIAAPQGSQLNRGSTYSRTPSGYGAWYAFMEARGTPLQRWQKPFSNLAQQKDRMVGNTLVRVHSSLTASSISSEERNWIARGNTLIVLGFRQKVSEAPFSSQHQSPVGSVKIHTGRRADEEQTQLLGDGFGAVVWLEAIGKGQAIYSTTPDLAANAYQDYPGNYEFLALLTTQKEPQKTLSIQNPSPQPPHALWIDEYIHGYKDTEEIQKETQGSIWNYWAKTPLPIIALQGVIVILVALYGGNRRFGQPAPLTVPESNNSQAYIEALAGVLLKAESSEFVVEVLGEEEQRQLQKALGLGSTLLDRETLVEAWVMQTGKPAKELKQVLQAQHLKHRLSEADLLRWLGKWKNIRRP